MLFESAADFPGYVADHFGGGIVENLPRVFPDGLGAQVQKSAIKTLPVFDFMSRYVEEEEMYRVFNMGIGFVLIVAEDFADSITKKLKKYGEQVYRIGRITSGKGNVILK